jgi:hypothetical protein
VTEPDALAGGEPVLTVIGAAVVKDGGAARQHIGGERPVAGEGGEDAAHG